MAQRVFPPFAAVHANREGLWGHRPESTLDGMKTNIDMGIAQGGAPALLDLEELLATRLLVQGNSGSGKSHLLRRLLEQSAPWVQQAVIDPEVSGNTSVSAFIEVKVTPERGGGSMRRLVGFVAPSRRVARSAASCAAFSRSNSSRVRPTLNPKPVWVSSPSVAMA